MVCSTVLTTAIGVVTSIDLVANSSSVYAAETTDKAIADTTSKHSLILHKYKLPSGKK